MLSPQFLLPIHRELVVDLFAIAGAVIAICGCSTWSAAQTDDALADLFHRAAVHRVPDGKGTEGGGL